ncbi:MAG TPA: RidA family protein [Candidatus Angelobacter sp.]|nr:RidA family protein [Candidatus Angelobacter sp.]
MHKHLNPPTVVKPFSRYSQAVEAPANARWLNISGQVGATPDGTILKGFEAQAKQCWVNIIAILAASGMGVEDLVKVNIFVTGTEYVGASRAIRDAALKGAEPASTYLVIAALAHPDLVVEIEAIAAKA